jgi:inner membrane protein
MEIFTIIAIILGIVLIIMETFIPGGVSMSIGISTIIIGTGYQFGLIHDPTNIFLSWSLLSLMFSFFGLIFINKFFSSDEDHEFCAEDSTDALGEKAIVVEDVDQNGGRVQFRGTSWKATTLSDKFVKGETVTIVSRDNLTWIVESVEN